MPLAEEVVSFWEELDFGVLADVVVSELSGERYVALSEAVVVLDLAEVLVELLVAFALDEPEVVFLELELRFFEEEDTFFAGSEFLESSLSEMSSDGEISIKSCANKSVSAPLSPEQPYKNMAINELNRTKEKSKGFLCIKNFLSLGFILTPLIIYVDFLRFFCFLLLFFVSCCKNCQFHTSMKLRSVKYVSRKRDSCKKCVL